MKRIGWLLLLVVVPALSAHAQAGLDSSGGPQAVWLRQQVLLRWRARVRAQLQLSDEQATKLQATEDRFLARRRGLAERQRAVLQGLRDQLQPGVTANPDSVRRLMDARDQNRAALGQVEREEDKEIAGYLSPVQHARYQFMRQRLQDRIAEMRRERGRGLGPRGRSLR